MKKALIMLLALTLMAGIALAKDDSARPHPFKDAVRAMEVEPNDDCTQANPLNIGDPMEASISPEGDNDWFEFFADAGQCVVFETFPGEGQVGGDTRLYLWEADCVTQAGFNDDGGEGLYSRLEFQFTVGGTYYVEIDEFGDNGIIDAYVLTAELCPPPPEEDGSICNFTDVCYVWDFAESDHGFTPVICDDGAPVWEYGATTFVPGAPGNVWGTVLEGDYVANSGDGLLSPAFTVQAGVCDYLEVRHYIHTERFSETSTLWDGCNVTVNGIVIPPAEGYSGVASTAATCVGGEEAWGGLSGNGPIRTWGRACFDLSQFNGETIQVSFDFGSDGSVYYPGWYLAYVKVGTTDLPIGTENQTWGTLKSLYR
jgi:hypothetical protein